MVIIKAICSSAAFKLTLDHSPCRDSTIADDTVAQYAVALVSRGSDEKKIISGLEVIVGADKAKELYEW